MIRKTVLGRDLPGGAPPPVVLTIAGFDPSSGAGVTADVQTFAAHGLFGTAVITALTVQSTRGVTEMQPVDADFVRRSLEHLVEDLSPVGIKLGMLGSLEVMRVVAAFLRKELGCGKKPVVVMDPVVRSSSGHGLFAAEAIEALHEELLPVIDWMTPNWGELSRLSGRKVSDEDTAELAAAALGRRHPHLTIVATGGENECPVDLIRQPGGELRQFEGRHIETTSTHGTGCAFSSALLALLVKGLRPFEAVAEAKRFVEGGLRHAPGVGGGHGPLDLLWSLRTESNFIRPDELPGKR